ncbi:MAG: ribulose-phosphate 3-epimerase [Acidobacteria bacterium]|nr:ribulose-phosphate 3-epimerase [Acidobacteriota bacterium]
MKLISPSILSADFTKLGEQLNLLMLAGMKYVHVDVMDGHFVPNITIGPMICRAVKRAVPEAKMDVHLMIENPGDYIEVFAETCPEIIYVHAEAEPHLDRVLGQIRQMGVRTGVVLNPATPLCFLEEVLPIVDAVLLMSVNPGFGGQSFIPYCLEKIGRLNALRADGGFSFIIAVDGGVTGENISQIALAGANLIVAGSAVFKGEPDKNFRELTQILNRTR